MKKYNMNDTGDYNRFLEESNNDDVVLFVCDRKEYDSNEEVILGYAEYVEGHNPECEALVALYWQDDETGEYECILYLHKNGKENNMAHDDYLKDNYLEARNKHEYDPKYSESSYSFEQIQALRNMAEKDVYPDIRFSDEECNIWSMFHTLCGKG